MTVNTMGKLSCHMLRTRITERGPGFPLLGVCDKELERLFAGKVLFVTVPEDAVITCVIETEDFCTEPGNSEKTLLEVLFVTEIEDLVTEAGDSERTLFGPTTVFVTEIEDFVTEDSERTLFETGILFVAEIVVAVTVVKTTIPFVLGIVDSGRPVSGFQLNFHMSFRRPEMQEY